MPTVLVLGASRGLGREFVRQYAAEGWRVLATCRRAQDAAALSPDCALVVETDLLDARSPAQLAAALGEESLDVAIINAGVYGPATRGLEPPEAEEFDLVLRTNVLVAMRFIPQLGERLAARDGRLVVISSRMGSIAGTSQPFGWLYRASKAALNSVLKSASVELGRQGVTCLSLHPGWVRTEMGGSGADLSPEDSVSAMRRVIASATASHNGRFLNFTGEHLEW